MAMTKVIGYKGHEPKKMHNYLLDNSVLLFAFAPIGNYEIKLQSSITKFIERCKTVDCGLSTTSLVISEFQNKVLKDFFEEYKKSIPLNERDSIQLKRDYRKSEEFKEDIEALKAATKSILKICDRYPDNFSSINMDIILENTQYADYNDAYFIEIANQKDWQIVTRDRDIVNNPYRSTDVISFLDR